MATNQSLLREGSDKFPVIATGLFDERGQRTELRRRVTTQQKGIHFGKCKHGAYVVAHTYDSLVKGQEFP